MFLFYQNDRSGDFPGGAVVKSLPAGAEDMDLGGFHVLQVDWAISPPLLRWLTHCNRGAGGP